VRVRLDRRLRSGEPVVAPGRRRNDLWVLGRPRIDMKCGLAVLGGGDLPVFSGSHWCNEPIAAALHVRDIGRILRIIAESAAQHGYGLVEGVVRNDNVLPDRIEELFDADDLAGVLGEANKDPHRSRLELGSYAASRNFIERGFYAPVANSKGRAIRPDHRLAHVTTTFRKYNRALGANRRICGNANFDAAVRRQHRPSAYLQRFLNPKSPDPQDPALLPSAEWCPSSSVVWSAAATRFEIQSADLRNSP
jgi:hypothetical protein